MRDSGPNDRNSTSAGTEVQPPVLSLHALADSMTAAGKRRSTARAMPRLSLRVHGYRRVVAPPGYGVGRAPLPGVAPLPDFGAVVAAKIIATFPPTSAAAMRAQQILEQLLRKRRPDNRPSIGWIRRLRRRRAVSDREQGE